MWWGIIFGLIGEIFKLLIILGVIFLIVIGVVSWCIMVLMVIGVVVMGMILDGIVFSEFMEIMLGIFKFMVIFWYY